MRLPARACSSALVLLGLLTTGVSAAAAADDPIREGGRWYINQTGLADIHQRTTGSGITVAVIDGPINPGIADLAGTDLVTHEPSFCSTAEGGTPQQAVTTDPGAEHGTAMSAILVGTGVGVAGQPGTLGVAPGVRLLHYAGSRGDEAADGTLGPCFAPAGRTVGAVRQAVDDGADIISMSITDADQDWADIAYAQQQGVIVVAASPHDGATGLKPPASGNGVVAVESMGPDGQLAAKNNTDPRLTVAAPGEYFATLTAADGWSVYQYTGGSSNATAYTSGALALVWSAYPDATANQMIQTLVRNTDAEDHELAHDDAWGYGAVNVRHMLEHDPTEYPDVNPLLTDDPDVRPSIAEITGAAATDGPTATAGASADPTSAPADDPAAGSSTMLVVGGIVAVLAVVGVAIAVLVARRRTGPTPPTT